MTAVEQLPLIQDRTPEPTPIEDSVVFAQRNSRAAVQLAIVSSGQDAQDIARQCDIDKATMSRVLSGQAHFPVDKIDEFNRAVGNTILLRWINHRCGHEGRPLLTTIEQQLEAERAKTRQLEHDNDLLRGLLTSGRR